MVSQSREDDAATAQVELEIPTASNWYRYEECPGSFRLSVEAKRLGQEAFTQTPEAASGTRVHAALAGERVELSAEEQRSVELLSERSLGEVRRIFATEPEKLSFLSEKRFYSPKGEFSGQIDRLWWNAETILVQDFKSGFREPEAADCSTQLRVLSVLAGLGLPDRPVVAQIISGPYGISETRFSELELAQNYEQLMATWRSLSRKEGFYHPGPKQCRYCPGIMICPALKARAERLLCAELPLAEMAGEVLDGCEVVSRRIEQIKGYYKELLLKEKGARIPGWGLAPGPGKREVADWRKARLRLEEFVPGAELDRLADYSIPKLEKLLVKTLGIAPGKAGAKLAEILGEQLSFKLGNLVLKRIEK